MEKDFDYYAFISYCREDEKWAKWLQNKLENYKLPAIIRKENTNLPQKIRPIFRDKTDMEAGAIIDTVQKKLERSQYLIVICSPKAAQSNWVGTEIDAFIEMGRSDCIIPFIVDGVPNSCDSHECLHPHIKQKIPEPLGINIKEIGKQQAFVKTAAKLLNIRFEVLWDRFQIAQRKRRIIVAAIGLFCLTALGLVCDYNIPKNKYYADYTDRNGKPEGIIKLNKAQVSKRNAHYRFEYSKWKLRMVVYANSAGTPVKHENIEYADRPSILELKYSDKRNSLSKTILKNENGETIVEYDPAGEKSPAIDIKNNRTVTNIERYMFTRNKKGYIVRLEFKRYNGSNKENASNIDGVWGYEYDPDNLGRPEKIWYLGPDKKPLPDKAGIMGKKYEYDVYGNIRKVTYFGKDEKPVLNKLGWSTAVYEADTNGNITEETYFDDHGNVIMK